MESGKRRDELSESDELERGDEEGEPDEGPGLLASYLTVMGILLATRLVAGLIESVSWRRRLYSAVLIACLLNAWLRRSILIVVLFVLVVSVGATTCRHGLPEANGPSLREFAGRVLDTAMKAGPGKQVRKIAEHERQRRERINSLIERATQLLAKHNAVLVLKESESPYLDAIRGRDPALRERAARLTAACDDADTLCQTARLLRFVADEIKYRKDPRSGRDYVQGPDETLRIRAGDCEDQTILLISLLENLGIKTLMAFTPDHAYPFVCWERSLQAELEDVVARRRGDRDYLLPILPPDLDRRKLSPRGYRVGDSYCYPLEPTARGSWIGHPQEMSEVRAIFDPIERKPLRFERAKPAPSR